MQQSPVTFDLDVTNKSPRVDLQASGNAYIGFPYPVTALVTDPNEADASVVCSNMTWTVEAPDVVSGSGCQVQVTFGAEGSRRVIARTTDTDGAAGTGSVFVTVEPESANPYPQIATYGVYGYDLVFFNGTPIGCDHVQVGTGATIDLRDLACSLVITGPDELRYSAIVTVTNPTAEALTYDWRLIVSVPGFPDATIRALNGDTTGEFLLYAPGNNALAGTDACRVQVTVNAPDPARSKTQTVWTGNCTYWTTRLTGLP